MPIRPELRHFYRTPEYLEARERVHKRSKNRCEQCGKPRRRHVWVVRAIDLWRAGILRHGQLDYHFLNSQFWSAVKGDGQRWRSCTLRGQVVKFKLRGRQWELAREIRVKVGCAHLDHDPSHNGDDNLKDLCDWCHLHHDQLHHRETRATRKDAKRPIQWEGGIGL